MDTQKKHRKSEVNTRTQKPENKDNHNKKKKEKKKRGEIRNSQQITKKKKKERERRNIPRKSTAQTGRGKSPEQSWNNRKSKRRGRDLEQ